MMLSYSKSDDSLDGTNNIDVSYASVSDIDRISSNSTHNADSEPAIHKSSLNRNESPLPEYYKSIDSLSKLADEERNIFRSLLKP